MIVIMHGKVNNDIDHWFINPTFEGKVQEKAVHIKCRTQRGARMCMELFEQAAKSAEPICNPFALRRFSHGRSLSLLTLE